MILHHLSAIPVVGLALLLTVPRNSRAAEPPGRTDLYGDPLPPGIIARLGTVRLRAPQGVRQMAFVPGGKFLATKGGRVLSVWDLDTGRVVRTISSNGTPQGDGFEDGFAFTSDGKLLLSADQPGNRKHGFRGEPRESRLHLWDFPSGKLLKRSPALGGVPKRLAIRPDGCVAAYSNHLGDVFLWDLEKNVVRRVGGAADIQSLSFAKEGKHLVVLPSEGGVSRRIDVASGKMLKMVDLGSCARVALAPHDGTIATYSDPDRLCLYDTLTGEKRRLPLKDKGNVLNLSFSSDGHTLLAMDRRAEVVQFWDAAKRQLLRRLHVPGLAWTHEHAELLLSANGKWLASYEEHRVMQIYNAVVRIWDARTGQPRQNLSGHVSPPDQLAFSADGKEVISHAHQEYSFRGQFYHWDVTTSKLLASVFPETPEEGENGATHDWQLAPGGQHLAVRADRATYLFQGSTGKRLALIDKAPPDSDWTFTPDGRALVTTGADQEVHLWDATTGKLLRRLELEKKDGPIAWLRITPDGRTLVTGQSWQQVHLWDVATGKHRATLTLPAKREPKQKPLDKWETAFTPNGRYLFVSNTTNLWVWDLVARREIGPFEQDKYEWTIAGSGRVAVSPDGRLMAWFDEAWKLRLYEISTGKIVHRFEEDYSSVTFAPSGWRLATGCNADASILIWDLPLLFRSQPFAGKDTSAEALWAVLKSGDAVQAYRALWRLAALPESDAFLARQLQPVEAVPPERLRALLSDLGSPDFATREKAEKALAAAGEAARAALVEALVGTKDAEVRRRLLRLQERLQTQWPERLREVRAVLMLESHRTPEARRLLQRLAPGQSQARLTQEAKAALERLPR
jgi:WD40 repeat protein